MSANKSWSPKKLVIFALAVTVMLASAIYPVRTVGATPGSGVTGEVLELRNLVETASLIVDCAVRRHESRGLHYTMDYPTLDESKPPQDTVLRRY